MAIKKINYMSYLQFVLLHVLIGFVIYFQRSSASILLLATWVGLFFWIILKNNRNNEALMAAAYIAGAEVFYRMNGAMIFYETGKYSVILFLLIGMFYKGTSSKTVPFWIYLLVLFPGVVVASFTLDYDVVFRKAVAFNLSGPVCLGVSALYCYYKRITFNHFNYVLLMLLLPLVANLSYLFFYTPSIGEALMSGTNSNYATSGGYGPNQISAVMGLGAFLVCTRLFVFQDRVMNLIDIILLALFSYRAIITFSRGGVLTAIICIATFIFIFYQKQNNIQKSSLAKKFMFLLLSVVVIWSFTAIKTEGLITYRYTNRNAAGELKSDITTGRAELIETELLAFYDSPVIGVGVGKAKKFRSEEAGTETASHNEISRLLSEHGMLGLVALLILISVPIVFWTKFKNNYYFLAFMAFWFLTINHSAMRIALPGFIYGLALLYIVDEKKDPVHRKRLTN